MEHLNRSNMSEGVLADALFATQGPLRGKRVVRGREQECQEYYRERGEEE